MNPVKARQEDLRPHQAAGPDAPCVLVVDDEPEITRSIGELLRPGFQVLTAGSADEALELIREHDIALILTDQRMPGGSGAELLARSLDVAPDATRVLFTGYSDIGAVIEAVNEGRIFHYVRKPWQPEELRAVVDAALERHRLVTENRRLLEEVTRANEDLVAANGELRELAHSIAHDVRAPLRAIDGYSALVERADGGVLSSSSLGHLQRAREAAQRMGVLIDRLLELTRISRVEVQVTDVDLTELAEAIVAELRESNPSRAVEAEVEPGLRALGDRTLVRVILANLLANAWRFTAGRATAHVRVGVTASAGEPAFFVEDDGVGFDPSHASNLFGVFQHVHPADAFDGDGVGVGLATVRRLVARHGGRVWADAGVDRGATFYFTLPGAPR